MVIIGWGNEWYNFIVWILNLGIFKENGLKGIKGMLIYFEDKLRKSVEEKSIFFLRGFMGSCFFGDSLILEREEVKNCLVNRLRF